MTADAGLAGVGSVWLSVEPEPIEVVMASAEPKPDFDRQARSRTFFRETIRAGASDACSGQADPRHLGGIA